MAATWKITLSHNLAGKTIPVKLKYEGKNFPHVTCNVTSSNKEFELEGWTDDELDPSKIQFVENTVNAGNITYNLRTLNIS